MLKVISCNRLESHPGKEKNNSQVFDYLLRAAKTFYSAYMKALEAENYMLRFNPVRIGISFREEKKYLSSYMLSEL